MSDRSRDSADGDDTVPHPLHVPALVGLELAERSLLDAHRSGRLHHAWLIGGLRGIGKATLAWHFARFLLANPDPVATAVQQASTLAVPPHHPVTKLLLAGGHADLFSLKRQWNDKTKKLFSEIRVDDVRAALGVFRRASSAGGYRICVVDSAEDLNRSSANALLKVLEEPPPRSLFLIVAHNPGQVLPTIVSRCRRLILPALSNDAVTRAVRGLGGNWATTEAERLAGAVARARGSVGEAIRLLGGEHLDVDEQAQALLSRLPDLDLRHVHRLADAVGMSDDRLDVVLRAIFDWLERRTHERAGHAEARVLMALADNWELIRRTAREAIVLNLDKRPLLLTIFNDLARSARMA